MRLPEEWLNAKSTRAFLLQVRLFERLSQDQIVQLARAATEKAFNPGDEACTEGEIASSMFAVYTGK